MKVYLVVVTILLVGQSHQQAFGGVGMGGNNRPLFGSQMGGQPQGIPGYPGLMPQGMSPPAGQGQRAMAGQQMGPQGGIPGYPGLMPGMGGAPQGMAPPTGYPGGMKGLPGDGVPPSWAQDFSQQGGRLGGPDPTAMSNPMTQQQLPINDGLIGGLPSPNWNGQQQQQQQPQGGMNGRPVTNSNIKAPKAPEEYTATISTMTSMGASQNVTWTDTTMISSRPKGLQMLYGVREGNKAVKLDDYNAHITFQTFSKQCVKQHLDGEFNDLLDFLQYTRYSGPTNIDGEQAYLYALQQQGAQIQIAVSASRNTPLMLMFTQNGQTITIRYTDFSSNIPSESFALPNSCRDAPTLDPSRQKRSTDDDVQFLAQQFLVLLKAQELATPTGFGLTY